MSLQYLPLYYPYDQPTHRLVYVPVPPAHAPTTPTPTTFTCTYREMSPPSPSQRLPPFRYPVSPDSDSISRSHTNPASISMSTTSDHTPSPVLPSQPRSDSSAPPPFPHSPPSRPTYWLPPYLPRTPLTASPSAALHTGNLHPLKCFQQQQLPSRHSSSLPPTPVSVTFHRDFVPSALPRSGITLPPPPRPLPIAGQPIPYAPSALRRALPHRNSETMVYPPGPHSHSRSHTHALPLRIDRSPAPGSFPATPPRTATGFFSRSHNQSRSDPHCHQLYSQSQTSFNVPKPKRSRHRERERTIHARASSNHPRSIPIPFDDADLLARIRYAANDPNTTTPPDDHDCVLRRYELEMRQQPVQARMCGVGEKSDRRPVDPTPIVQLRVIDQNQDDDRDPNNDEADDEGYDHDRRESSHSGRRHARGGRPDSSGSRPGSSKEREEGSKRSVTNLGGLRRSEGFGGMSYMQNPYYFLYASLVGSESDSDRQEALNGDEHDEEREREHDPDPQPQKQNPDDAPDPQQNQEELHVVDDGKSRFLTGTPVSSLYHLKDLDNSDAAFFVFPDLGVRKEGRYRLKLSLFEIVDQEVFFCTTMHTSPFSVYSAKKFPGMSKATELSKTFADQGLKIRVRKDPRLVDKRSKSKRKSSLVPSDADSQPEASSNSKRSRLSHPPQKWEPSSTDQQRPPTPSGYYPTHPPASAIYSHPPPPGYPMPPPPMPAEGFRGYPPAPPGQYHPGPAPPGHYAPPQPPRPVHSRGHGGHSQSLPPGVPGIPLEHGQAHGMPVYYHPYGPPHAPPHGYYHPSQYPHGYPQGHAVMPPDGHVPWPQDRERDDRDSRSHSRRVPSVATIDSNIRSGHNSPRPLSPGGPVRPVSSIAQDDHSRRRSTSAAGHVRERSSPHSESSARMEHNALTAAPPGLPRMTTGPIGSSRANPLNDMNVEMGDRAEGQNQIKRERGRDRSPLSSGDQRHLERSLNDDRGTEAGRNRAASEGRDRDADMDMKREGSGGGDVSRERPESHGGVVQPPALASVGQNRMGLGHLVD